MKILFTLAGLGRGGAERQAIILAEELQKRGHDIRVSVAYAGDHYERHFRELGIPVLHLIDDMRPVNPPLAITALHIIRRTIALIRSSRNGKYDIIQSYGRSAGVYTWPLNYFTHSKVVFGVRGSAKVANPIYRFLQSRAANASSLVIANSTAGRNVVVSEGVDPDRIAVIANGIDTDRFMIDASWRREVRDELGLGEDEHLIGIVGRLNPVKDHESFLMASAKIAQTGLPYRFIVVGHDEPPRLSNLQALAKELGIEDKIIWAGPRDDIERVLNAFDVCVLCSRTEGFPNVVAEAMACGVPCVVTEAGEAPAIVGIMGKVVPYQRPEILAEAIKDLAENRNHYSPESLRAKVAENWSVQRLVETTERAYRHLVSA